MLDEAETDIAAISASIKEVSKVNIYTYGIR